MEKLNWHLADQLSRKVEMRIVGPSGAKALKPDATEVDEVPLKPLWGFLLGTLRTACSIARQWKPDVILAGSGLTAPIALIAARLCNARSAVYLHGLDITVPNRVYRLLWLPLIRRIDFIFTNSQPTSILATTAGINRERIQIVHPGVELKPLGEWKANARRFRDRYQLGDCPLLLSVGRLTARKGLLEFVTRCLPEIARSHPDVVLLVIGDAASNALHSKAQSIQDIEAAAKAAGIDSNVRFLGVVPENELLAAMDASNLHIFPVREVPGDPEGFGMVAIEAAARGLPTAAFACGGVIDAVRDGVSGRIVEQGDYPALTQVVLELLAENGAHREGAIAFAHSFSWPRFGEQILSTLLQGVPR
jgi:phosphatidylinositol alpha-1,6-mannosyltransferase